MARIAVSWSGGKDCCYSLYKALQEGHRPVCLITTIPAESHRTFGHGYKLHVLEAQSKSLGIPLEIIYVNENYRERFIETLLKLRLKWGIEGVVFGDLYLWEHRNWCEDVCSEAGVHSYFPFWIEPHQASGALQDFLRSGFKSLIVRVRKGSLGAEWVGKYLDASFATHVNGRICPMGEAGEYHTLVTDGPLFKKPLSIIKSRIAEDESTYILEIEEVV